MQDEQLLLEQKMLRDHRAHATGATQPRGHDGQVKQGEQEGLHPRDRVGRTSGATQRCLILESARALGIRDVQAYPAADALYITADAGGSNGYRTRGWKTALQRLADDLGLSIHVSHFPPGTSKWNKIEHRLFCHITENWRGRPLQTFETIVELIGHTRTATGLRVKAKLDKRRYKTGLVVTPAEMRALDLHPHSFHGDWNYELRPRPT